MGKSCGAVQGSPDGVQVKRDGLPKSRAIHSGWPLREAVCPGATPGLGTTQSIPTAAATFRAYYPEDSQQGWEARWMSRIVSIPDCQRLGLSASRIVSVSERQHPGLFALRSVKIVSILDCPRLGSSASRIISVSDHQRLVLSALWIVRAPECQDCQHPGSSTSWMFYASSTEQRYCLLPGVRNLDC